jgi:outer membrane receptor protein involved in Fe transport
MASWGRVWLLLFNVAFGVVAVRVCPAAAQTPQPAAAPPSAQTELPTIYVEGTRAKHARGRPHGRAVAPTPLAAARSAPAPAAAPPGMGELSTDAAALPAAATTLTAQQIAQTPVASYGDIFRPLPGFEVANYGQGAIGYGVSMRGYTNAEHGRDIAYYIDGVPVNDISSIHTPNYADLNILMPETMQSIDVVRGPFDVECGDSSLGGCVMVTTKQSEPFASAAVSGGSFATARPIVTYSEQGGSHQPFFVEQGYATEGYRDNSYVNDYNSFDKISAPLADGVLSIRTQAYGTWFGAPGYINRDAVASGALSPRAAVNPTDGGNKDFENLTANYTSGPADQNFAVMAFVNHDVFNRYADFGSGQTWQEDERSTAGGRIRKVWTAQTGEGTGWQVLVGGAWRTDFIQATQGPTAARVLDGPLAESVGDAETNLSAYAQLQYKPFAWLKLSGGGRLDQFFYDVTDNLNQADSTRIAPTIWSPKVGVAVIPLRWLDLYANYGQGFRSVDAATELIGNPTIQPFKIQSEETGVHLAVGRVVFHGDVYATQSQNEAFQPAPGLPETFLGAAHRNGYDLDGRYDVIKSGAEEVVLFANYGAVTARLLNAAPSLYVPNVPAYVANIGIAFNVATRGGERLSGSAFVSFVGPQNLTQDGALTTSSYQRVAGKLAYSWPNGWTIFSEATWYPGDTLSEFAINLGPVTGAASSDIYTAPVPRWTMLAGVAYRIPTVAGTLASLFAPGAER